MQKCEGREEPDYSGFGERVEAGVVWDAGGSSISGFPTGAIKIELASIDLEKQLAGKFDDVEEVCCPGLSIEQFAGAGARTWFHR